MFELRIEARKENLDRVMAFADDALEESGCPMKAQMQIDVAVEEIFVNIASYAYEDTGDVLIQLDVRENPAQVAITFTDSGVPFDPTKREDPDVTLSADQRQIGGLGIFMARKTMDSMTYARTEGQNVLTITKNL